MAQTHVCPWQTGNLLALSARKLMHNPERMLSPTIAEGMTVMDVGCGMGYFTIPMARMVGAGGSVIAADVQREMLEGTLMRAERAGMQSRIEPRLCGSTAMNIGDLDGKIDFALLFMMLHEVPDRERMVREVCAALAPGGKLLFAEPVVHVSKKSFEASLECMRAAGLTIVKTPDIALCRGALLEKL